MLITGTKSQVAGTGVTTILPIRTVKSTPSYTVRADRRSPSQRQQPREEGFILSAHEPGSYLAIIVVLAIAAMVWWRATLMIIGIGLLILCGLGATAMFHVIHLGIR